MLSRITLILSLVVSLSVVSCAPKSEQARETLKRPVYCQTAEQDIAVLERERANVARRIAVGATNIAPAGAAMRILRRQWRDGMRVATGAYNRDLEAKIAEIKRDCGVS